ncbi:hypothetical protein E2C01_002255 [Portunus trituberculatus]|uniref:Uncharacterized protein n=1 Tax=Portunus trituberculatus TaxID=210409 RepID=A0A5B7CJX2_PORTR|nr:hypothetical protein [Portunus trituberculatus]
MRVSTEGIIVYLTARQVRQERRYRDPLDLLHMDDRIPVPEPLEDDAEDDEHNPPDGAGTINTTGQRTGPYFMIQSPYSYSHFYLERHVNSRDLTERKTNSSEFVKNSQNEAPRRVTVPVWSTVPQSKPAQDKWAPMIHLSPAPGLSVGDRRGVQTGIQISSGLLKENVTMFRRLDHSAQVLSTNLSGNYSDSEDHSNYYRRY